MTASSLNQQVRLQNSLIELEDRAREERGEIGSQLILMAILVGAAVAAATVLRPAIEGLVGRIADGINGS